MWTAATLSTHGRGHPVFEQMTAEGRHTRLYTWTQPCLSFSKFGEFSTTMSSSIFSRPVSFSSGIYDTNIKRLGLSRGPKVLLLFLVCFLRGRVCSSTPSICGVLEPKHVSEAVFIELDICSGSAGHLLTWKAFSQTNSRLTIDCKINGGLESGKLKGQNPYPWLCTADTSEDSLKYTVHVKSVMFGNLAVTEEQ